MRRCYILIAIAVVLSGIASVVADSSQDKLMAVEGDQTTGTVNRFLRRDDELSAENTEERIVAGDIPLSARMINNIYKVEKRIVDPKLADELLEKPGLKTLKTHLDAALPYSERAKVFERWHADGVDPSSITKALKVHPAIAKKYNTVSTMYDLYVKSAAIKRLTELKRKSDNDLADAVRLKRQRINE